MSRLLNKMNAINLIKEGVEKHIKEAVFNAIVEDAVKHARHKIENEVQEIMEDLIIEQVEHNHNLQFLRDELHVFIRMREGGK